MMAATSSFNLITCNNLTDLGTAYFKERQLYPERFRGSDFFSEETICVASQGMGIWLEHYLVGQGHVMAGTKTRFIRDVIDELLEKFMEGNGHYRPELFEEEVLIWRIFKLLGELSLDKSGIFKGIIAYLQADGEEDENSDVRRYHLACKLAQLYYDYMAFIPEKLHPEIARTLGFSEKDVALEEENRWELEFWKKLCVDEDGQEALVSPAAAMLMFLSKKHSLDASQFTPITFFGISAMAPYFLLMLKKISSVVPVNFYYLNYCDELWDNVKSDKEKRREVERDLDEHFNTLLGNFGIQGREFFKVVLDNSDDVYLNELSAGVEEKWKGVEVFRDEERRPFSLLKQIQCCIKTNQEEFGAEVLLQNQDDSLTIHNCFNENREVEALHDCLLKLISEYRASGKPLAMNDIIVMAPDISRFAPAIHSVFGRGILKSKYSISDRSVKSANLLAETFLNIMKLSNYHFELSKINSLLDSAALRKKFGFEEEDVLVVREWFRKAGIHWGRDKEDRNSQGEFEEYSWQYGLDRMLLKLAMDGEGRYGELQPVDYNTGKDNQHILDGLLRLYRELGDFVSEIASVQKTGRSASEWCDFLLEKRAVFFQVNGDSALEYSMLGKSISEMKKALQTAGYSENGERLSYAVILAAMEGAMALPAKGEPFLNGKITFCSLLPMRGIPCKIIALLGMDAGEFPRPNDATVFNLVGQNGDGRGKTGNLLKYYDRSRNLEDRFTFLEALMSAQDYLMIFYKGQDDQTLKDLVAASPVTELLNYIKALRHISEKNQGNESWPCVKHTLNAFDPRAFAQKETQRELPTTGGYTGSLLTAFSYDKQMAAVAGVRPKMNVGGTSFWKEAYQLPLPDVFPKHWQRGGHIIIEMDDLVGFFKNPSEKYGMIRLGVPKSLWEDEPLSDYEPFEMNPLNASRLRGELMSEQLTQEEFQVLDSNSDSRMEQLYQGRRLDYGVSAGEMGRIDFVEQQVGSWIEDTAFREELRIQEESDEEEFRIHLGTVSAGSNILFMTALTECLKEELLLGESLNTEGTMAFLEKPLPYFDVTLKGKFKMFRKGDSVGIRQWFSTKNLKGRHLLPLFLKHIMVGAQEGTEHLKTTYCGYQLGQKSRGGISCSQEETDKQVAHYIEVLTYASQYIEHYSSSSEDEIFALKKLLLSSLEEMRAFFAEKSQGYQKDLGTQMSEIAKAIETLLEQLKPVVEAARIKGIYGALTTSYKREVWQPDCLAHKNVFQVARECLGNLDSILEKEKLSKISNKKQLSDEMKQFAQGCEAMLTAFKENYERIEGELRQKMTGSARKLQEQAEHFLSEEFKGYLGRCREKGEFGNEEGMILKERDCFIYDIWEGVAEYTDEATNGEKVSREKAYLKRLCGLYLIGHFYPLPFFVDGSYVISTNYQADKDCFENLKTDLKEKRTAQLYGVWIEASALLESENRLVKRVAQMVYPKMKNLEKIAGGTKE